LTALGLICAVFTPDLSPSKKLLSATVTFHVEAATAPSPDESSANAAKENILAKRHTITNKMAKLLLVVLVIITTPFPCPVTDKF
jgi:hypothetical protein